MEFCSIYHIRTQHQISNTILTPVSLGVLAWAEHIHDGGIGRAHDGWKVVTDGDFGYGNDCRLSLGFSNSVKHFFTLLTSDVHSGWYRLSDNLIGKHPNDIGIDDVVETFEKKTI